MKLKKSEVFGIESVLNSLMETPLDPEVAFKVASNVILASETTEAVRKSYKPVDGYEDIEKLRNELIEKSGGERTPNGQFTLPAEKAAEIGKAVEAFNAEHKDIVEKQKAYQEKFDAMLDKNVDIDFKIINRKELTAEIKPGQLVLLIKVGMLTDGSKPRDI